MCWKFAGNNYLMFYLLKNTYTPFHFWKCIFTKFRFQFDSFYQCWTFYVGLLSSCLHWVRQEVQSCFFLFICFSVYIPFTHHLPRQLSKAFFLSRFFSNILLTYLDMILFVFICLRLVHLVQWIYTFQKFNIFWTLFIQF